MSPRPAQLMVLPSVTPSKRFTLFPDQEEALRAIREAYERGVRRQLVVAPTGAGKTLLVARVPELIGDPRMVYVAHREELLHQTLGTLRRERPDRPAGLERAASRAGLRDLTVVASIQSLWRPDRLARYRPEDWPLMAIDEAHRAVADSYLTVLHHFRFLSQNGQPPRRDGLLLGTTATSQRTDEIGLGHVFDEVVFHRTLRDMIEADRLVPLRGFLWRGDADLDAIRTTVTHGERDYDERALARAVNTPDRNRIVVDATRHIALAEGRATLVFTADVEHSDAVAACFRAAGITAASVHGELPMRERAAMLDAFRSGEVDVLVNCNLLLEGVDIPKIAAVVMARPTQSALLFAQAIGRGCRKAAGKTDCIVVDIVDNTKQHAASLVTMPTLFGLPPHFNLAGHAAHEAARQVEEAATLLDGGFDEQTVQRIRSAADIPRLFEEVDLLRIAGLPRSVSRLTRFAWQRLPDGTFALPARRDLRLEIAPNTLGHYEIRERPLDVPARKLAEFGDLAAAFRGADGVVFRRFRERVRLLDKTARWRREPATEKQLDVLRAPDMARDLARFLGIRDLPKGLTKGQVQILIDRVKALRRQRRM
jgi:ATP-dependent helicase IRC3